MDDTTGRLAQRVARVFHRDVDNLSVDENESELARYFEDYVADGRHAVRFILKHPRRSVNAFVASYRLPRHVALLSDSIDGDGIRRGLSRSSPILGRTVFHSTTAVLAVPADPAQYSLGSSKQTLRRKVRAAQKLGVSWKRVDDLEERRHLLQLANERERTHPRADYRREPENSDMLPYGLWLVAVSPDDRPLVLSVSAVDGEWSTLRHFCTLGDGDQFSNARYFLTQVLVEELSRAGVRYLADVVSPAYLPNGLRSFQRVLGYRMVRLDLADRDTSAATASRSRSLAQ